MFCGMYLRYVTRCRVFISSLRLVWQDELGSSWGMARMMPPLSWLPVLALNIQFRLVGTWTELASFGPRYVGCWREWLKSSGTTLSIVLNIKWTGWHLSWWRHQTETFPRYWPFVRGIHRSPVNFPHKGQWRGALMFSLICDWINDWVNKLGTGDLRRHRAHYDVTVMCVLGSGWKLFRINVCYESGFSNSVTKAWDRCKFSNLNREYEISLKIWSHGWTQGLKCGLWKVKFTFSFFVSVLWNMIFMPVAALNLVSMDTAIHLGCGWTKRTNSVHDDVIKREHFPRYWPFVRGIHRSPVNSPHKGQWRGALMFPLICTWINGWVNNREAGDLRRHRTHYEAIVMISRQTVAHLSLREINTFKHLILLHFSMFSNIVPDWNLEIGTILHYFGAERHYFINTYFQVILPWLSLNELYNIS